MKSRLISISQIQKSVTDILITQPGRVSDSDAIFLTKTIIVNISVAACENIAGLNKFRACHGGS